MRDTSINAFLEVLPKLNEKQKAVIEALQGSSPLTNTELAAKVGWTINRITPRIYELREMSLVGDFGIRPCSITGRAAHQWGIMTTTLTSKPKMRLVQVPDPYVPGRMMAKWVPNDL